MFSDVSLLRFRDATSEDLGRRSQMWISKALRRKMMANQKPLLQ